MATLKDLGIPALSEESPDEQLEHIRQIRLSRRVPVKSNKKTSSATKQKKAPVPKVSKTQASNLLAELEGLLDD